MREIRLALSIKKNLAECAKESTKKKSKISVVISNHDTKFTREIYKGAKFKRVKVQRSISQSSRKTSQSKRINRHL